MSEKFKTAAEYSGLQTDACETAFVRLMQAFGSLKGSLRLIGGLVPRYLTPARPPEVPPHAGTTDVDVVLDIALIDAGEGYAKLRAQLRGAGFARYRPTNAWQWTCDVDGHTVLVEFLMHADRADELPRVVSLAGEDVSACRIPHAGVAQDWYGEHPVSVRMPDGDGILQERIRHADVVAFVVLKAVATSQRAERKDAADLVHVMRYFDGGVDRIAQRFAECWHSGLHRLAMDEALAALRRCFCDDALHEGHLKVGPSRFARFHGLREGDDAAVLEQRQVSAMVAYFLDRVEALGVDVPPAR